RDWRGLPNPAASASLTMPTVRLRGKIDAIFEDTGEHELKNIARPVRVYQFNTREGTAQAPALVLPDKPSVAVLPFQNLSGDPEQEYFAEVGRELGVRYVLEGSIRKAADRVRITGQLIDATTGAHVLAERYDRRLEDIFALHDEITLSV